MSSLSSGSPQPASEVDPASIGARVVCGPGVELFERRRPPGAVELGRGHREHLLMCTSGQPAPGVAVRSVLRTADGEREWRSCPRGEVSFVPAGFPLTWEWSYTSESVHLTMLPAFVDGIAVELGAQPDDRPLRPLFRVRDDTLARLLRSLRVETRARQAGWDLATSSLLTLVGLHLHRRSGDACANGETQRPSTLSADDHRRSVELLRDRLGENVSLAELASEVGMSPWHFARCFKQATGLPPHRYQLELRIDRARRLLRMQPSRTVAEIACELGFADESHLRRHFKRIVGTTPGRYRREQ